MDIRILNATFGLWWVMVVGASGQASPPKITIGGPPQSLTAQLKQHHIELTEAGLISALQNSDAHVRDLAAARLAEEKDVAAVPAIEDALAKEKIAETRVDMAFSLALLGQEKGTETLTEDCNDPKLEGYFRVRAMTYMLRLGSATCFRAALDLLGSDPGSRQQLLSLLPQYPHSSEEESKEILGAIARCLSDESSIVRIQASDALRTLGNPSAIPFLQNALAKEHEDVVRSQMQAALENLQAGKR